MTEPAYLREIRTSYDSVADSYAGIVPALFDEDLFGRAMLGAFAGLVPPGLPVADVGCGPGHVTAHLRGLGLDAHGIDLSPGMIDAARRAHPGTSFEVGTMTALAAAGESLGGVVAWYSLIHLPQSELPLVMREFHRVLVPGGRLLLGFHAGSGTTRKRSGYGGHPMAVDVHRLEPEHLAGLAEAAGLVREAVLAHGPARPAGCVQLFKPAPAEGP